VKKGEGGQEHKDRLRARLRVQQRHQESQRREREVPWWRRKEFLISTALAVIALALGVPSIIPKVTATYEGLNANGIPSFKVSNDSLLGLNNISARCQFVKVDYSSGRNVTNNVVGFDKLLDAMAPGHTALVICPFPIRIDGDKILGGSMKIEVKFRPDYGPFYQTSRIPFVSGGIQGEPDQGQGCGRALIR
jgi:hypothetical protein